MKITVQKFGGSSLNANELREQVVKHIKVAISDGYAPVVVVSAIGRDGEPYATDTLIKLAKSISPTPDPSNLDLLLNCGEVISATLLVETLNQHGIAATALTGWQSGIITDKNYGRARVLSVDPSRVKQVLEAGQVCVVAGFQGVTSDGEITTLGRGGSDTTAVVIAAALQCQSVEIYTDVDGVKVADPHLVPNAPTLVSLDYHEIMEMAHLGTKVIHPRAVEIAMKSGIDLKILSTKAGYGTLITNQAKGYEMSGEQIADRVVTGIANLGDRAHVKISGPVDFNQSPLKLRIFELLAQNKVSVDLIYLSPGLIAFIIDNEMSQLVKKVLADLGLNIIVEQGYAKVSIVGAGMHGVPGVMSRLVSSLTQVQVAIYQTTDSHANISCLIKETDLSVAVKALCDEFDLIKEGEG